MSEKKNNKSLLGFIKKNLYYLVIGVSLAIIATVIAVVLVTNKNRTLRANPNRKRLMKANKLQPQEEEKNRKNSR